MKITSVTNNKDIDDDDNNNRNNNTVSALYNYSKFRDLKLSVW